MKKQIGSKKDVATTMKISISLWAAFFQLCTLVHYFYKMLIDTIWGVGRKNLTKYWFHFYIITMNNFKRKLRQFLFKRASNYIN